MKSHEKQLIPICRCILMDARAKCSTDLVNVERDLVRIKSRSEHEGLSFLTITLPAFGKSFEKALAAGSITSIPFPGWGRVRCLPEFLQGFTRLVFNAETGGLLDDPCVEAIEGIRQLANTFKKLLLPCTPERERKALTGYKKVECILRESMYKRPGPLFSEVSRLLWGNVLSESYDSLRYIPRHGPGQTGERIVGNQKYAQRVWYERLEPFFPADAYLMASIDHLVDTSEGIGAVSFVPFEDELPVRVTCVPKTLKGPRIIAIEPVCMQYAQQALASYLIKRLETHKMTRGHINFSDQTVNRGLAVSASLDGRLATLDLSDASDRVPMSFVSEMLSVRPDFRDAVMACRSRAAQMPDGEILHLYKFASMGSALCFPIEAMYFYTVVLTALLKEQELPVTLRNLHIVSRDVYVYGDDIFVPVEQVEAVTKTLAENYCKVNTDKSFWSGKFRESCGMDAYGGYEVTPTYMRRVQPSGRGEVSELVSWIASSNQFYLKGYWETASYFKDIVEAILGELPIVQETSPGIGWLSYQCAYQFDGWNRHLQQVSVKTYVLTPVYEPDALEGWSALLKCLLSAEKRSNEFISIDEKHLERRPRSGTFSMKRRRTLPF